MSTPHNHMTPGSGTNVLPANHIIVALAFFIVTSKLILIALFASQVPTGDEWPFVSGELYGPYLAHQLSWHDMFAAHFEHRLFTTRVLNLFLLEINGQVWSPILQMLASALIHTLALVLVARCLLTACPPPQRLLLLAFMAVVMVLPFGAEDILCAFQSQLYFELIFSFYFLWAVCLSKPLSLAWYLGLAAAVLAIFSQASGPICIIAGIIVLVLRRLKAQGRKGDMPLLAVLLALTLGAIMITPTVAASTDILAHSAWSFLVAFASLTSWPGLPGFALVLYFPFALFAWRLLRSKAPQDGYRWFMLALGLWVLGQITTIAYGRGGGIIFASRYEDLFILGLPLNFACLLVNKAEAAKTVAAGDAAETTEPYLPFDQLWILIVMGFGIWRGLDISPLISSIHDTEQAQLANVAAYLQTGNADILTTSSYPNIPFPDAALLKAQLDNPLIRHILPPELVPANGSRQAPLLAFMINHVATLACLSALAMLTAAGWPFIKRLRQRGSTIA
jgi:hypothetical protein